MLVKNLVFFLVLLFPATAFAISLDAAKGQGLVGETPSGYLKAVDGNPSGEVQALVQDINQKRRAEYSRIAGKNGTSVSAVEALAGKKAIESTKPGLYVQNAAGAWVKK